MGGDVQEKDEEEDVFNCDIQSKHPKLLFKVSELHRRNPMSNMTQAPTTYYNPDQGV
jgi:hypothetical protein